jgi:hypothetical protein
VVPEPRPRQTVPACAVLALTVALAGCGGGNIGTGARDGAVGDGVAPDDAGVQFDHDTGLLPGTDGSLPPGTEGGVPAADGGSPPADGGNPPEDATPPADSSDADGAPEGCSLDLTHLSAAGCQVVKSDMAADAEVVALWGPIACQAASRVQFMPTDGDTHLTATGAAQGNTGYRRATVLDGDDFYGERCELGDNDWRGGSFQIYRQGERRITFISLRLSSSLPLGTNLWQVVLQMKQAQPSDNGGGTPVLALEARDGQWLISQSNSAGPSEDTHVIWSTPAEPSVWTRFAFDVTYSPEETAGAIQVYVDLNGDGDALDAGEMSPRIATYTEKYEIAGNDGDGLSAGDAIPSHLRVGPYHDPSIACPAPTGCAVEIDNVQVVAPE